MQTKRLALIALASSLALVLAFAYAHVMSYYPVQVTLAPSTPSVVFAPGNNAGGTDINGSTIGVSIGSNGTSLTLTLHPTYEITYYKNITIIKNIGNKAYYVNMAVAQPLDLGVSGAAAYIIVAPANAPRNPIDWDLPSLINFPSTLAKVDLTNNVNVNLSANLGTLGVGDFWEVDLLVYIPEGAKPVATTTAKLYLIVTPQP